MDTPEYQFETTPVIPVPARKLRARWTLDAEDMLKSDPRTWVKEAAHVPTGEDDEQQVTE